MEIKRVFLIILDSFGIGALPDAHLFGDEGSNTLKSIRASSEYSTPNLEKLGLFHIDGVLTNKVGVPTLGSYARMQEASMGKDTTIGHWEIAGIIKEEPLPTYKEGFPEGIIKELSRLTGRGILCNKPYSGTEVLKDYGQEHLETGNLIVYTSADSVLQIAAHEEVVPVETLYEYCKMARNLMKGEHGVGRIIARPFIGEKGNFKRTARRHDYSLEPPRKTMLDYLVENGFETRGVGKIYDIFAGKGITKTITIENNQDGMDKTLAWMKEEFTGLCFVNLVDFDMLYGHRNDINGYARAATLFDLQLKEAMGLLRKGDVLMITGDHGCDPGTKSTDHSREYTPLLVYGPQIKEEINLGTRKTFADIGKTILQMFHIEGEELDGESFLDKIEKRGCTTTAELIEKAMEAAKEAYCPYSNFQVGAAIEGVDGNIYKGCNIENASYGATNCAERTAVFQGVVNGTKTFERIAIYGGKIGEDKVYPFPCGICLQVLQEFASDDNFQVIVAKSKEDYNVYFLKELLPYSFSQEVLSNENV